MTSDDLIARRLSATPPDLPVFLGDLSEVTRRVARRRKRKLIGTVVACAAIAVAVIVPLAAINPLGSHPSRVGSSPHGVTGPSPTPSYVSPDPFDRPPLRAVKVVSERVISADAHTLTVQAPVGVASWTVHGCEVRGGPVGQKPVGGFGGSCGSGPYLWASEGGLAVSGTFYDSISGQTLPSPGVRVVVRFVNGTKATVRPSFGQWIVFFLPHPEMYRPGSPIAVVKAVDANGHVIGVVHVPNR